MRIGELFKGSGISFNFARPDIRRISIPPALSMQTSRFTATALRAMCHFLRQVIERPHTEMPARIAPKLLSFTAQAQADFRADRSNSEPR